MARQKPTHRRTVLTPHTWLTALASTSLVLTTTLTSTSPAASAAASPRQDPSPQIIGGSDARAPRPAVAALTIRSDDGTSRHCQAALVRTSHGIRALSTATCVLLTETTPA